MIILLTETINSLCKSPYVPTVYVLTRFFFLHNFGWQKKTIIEITLLEV